MKLIHESALITEIIFQAGLVSHAAERLNDSVDEFGKVAVWSSIQSILISSSNISKILWPTRRKYKKRGEHLRKLLKIDSESVLRSRKFRNKFEHYDNLLDDFFEDNNICSYTDLALNPFLSSIGTSCHRGFNTYNNTLVIHGEILDLNNIVAAVKQVKHKCESSFT